MTLEEIKQRLGELSADEREEIAAYLFHLRRVHDREYQERIGPIEADKNPAHWLTPAEFEKRLGAF